MRIWRHQEIMVQEDGYFQVNLWNEINYDQISRAVRDQWEELI